MSRSAGGTSNSGLQKSLSIFYGFLFFLDLVCEKVFQFLCAAGTCGCFCFFVYVAGLPGGPILSVFKDVLFPVPFQAIVSAPAGITCPDTAHMGSINSPRERSVVASFAHVGRVYEANERSASPGSPGGLQDPSGSVAPRVGGSHLVGNEVGEVGVDLPREKVG